MKPNFRDLVDNGSYIEVASAEFEFQVVKSPKFVKRARELPLKRRAVLLDRVREAGEPGVEVDEGWHQHKSKRFKASSRAR